MSDIKELALEYYQTTYWEKWRGATIKSIVINSFVAGYKKGTESD